MAPAGQPVVQAGSAAADRWLVSHAWATAHMMRVGGSASFSPLTRQEPGQGAAGTCARGMSWAGWHPQMLSTCHLQNQRLFGAELDHPDPCSWEKRKMLTGEPAQPKMAALVSVATRAGFRQEFSQRLWAGKSGGSLTALTFTPQCLLRPVSHGDRTLSHFQPPATVTAPQFLESESGRLWARGGGGWALQDIMFLAPVGGNVLHVFPCVYRAEGTECSPRCGSWPAGAWPGQHTRPVPGRTRATGRPRAAWRGGGRVIEQGPELGP